MLASLRNTCGQWSVVYQDIAGAPKWWYNVDCASSKGEIGGVTHPTGHPHARCCQGGPSAAYCCRCPEYPCGAYACAHGAAPLGTGPHPFTQLWVRRPFRGGISRSSDAPTALFGPASEIRSSSDFAVSCRHTRGRGFRGDERPQVSSPSGQLHAGRNAHRARPGGPAVPPTFRQLSRTI
ncbi:hypothetical protein NDU88_001301 [Pleurodeles waltl]|uniref:Uncharacterized protein n=1 Tax=Pleurodeles waltl TaxID=8319 RepID=A0AAV7NER1_PLEWA|nr:hypothetical protein NDU88_001301 [Pleurodeles waltl]